MNIPAHIDPRDQSAEANRERAYHRQGMMELRPNGNGFRRIPEHSSQVSIVEAPLIAAGDMKAPKRVPDDRRYRQKHRPRTKH